MPETHGLANPAKPGELTSLVQAQEALGARSIGTRNPYVVPYQQLGAVAGIPAIQRPIRIVLDENVVLASLPPSRRWRYMARHQPFDFIVSVAALVVGVYLIVVAVSNLVPSLAWAFDWSASAQAGGSVMPTTTRDLFDWYLGGLMGLALVVSFLFIGFANADEKVSFGKETCRTILSFIVGVFAGTKVR
jgi:hypothetical protein